MKKILLITVTACLIFSLSAKAINVFANNKERKQNGTDTGGISVLKSETNGFDAGECDQDLSGDLGSCLRENRNIVGTNNCCTEKNCESYCYWSDKDGDGICNYSGTCPNKNRKQLQINDREMRSNCKKEDCRADENGDGICDGCNVCSPKNGDTVSSSDTNNSDGKF